MKITIDIPEYIKGDGVEYIWNEKGELSIKCEDNYALISGNTEGLKLLGEQLIYLSTLDKFSHVHFDEVLAEIQGGKINGELIIEKL